MTQAVVCTGCSCFNPLDADAYTAHVLTTSPTQPLQSALGLPLLLAPAPSSQAPGVCFSPTPPNCANSPAAALNRRVRRSLGQTALHPPLPQALRPSARREPHRSGWLAALALAIALGVAMRPSHAEAKSPAAASPPAAQGGKDSNPLLAFARELGAPAWLLSAGGVMGAMFLLGEPLQKNLKAWRESLGLKPEPASTGSPAPEPLPPAPGAPIAGKTVSGNDNQSLQQTFSPHTRGWPGVCPLLPHPAAAGARSRREPLQPRHGLPRPDAAQPSQGTVRCV